MKAFRAIGKAGAAAILAAILLEAEARARRPAGHRRHRAVPQGNRRIRLCRSEKSAVAEMVSAVAGTNDSRALPAIREIPGFRRRGSEFAGRGTGRSEERRVGKEWRCRWWLGASR